MFYLLFKKVLVKVGDLHETHQGEVGFKGLILGLTADYAAFCGLFGLEGLLLLLGLHLLADLQHLSRILLLVLLLILLKLSKFLVLLIYKLILPGISLLIGLHFQLILNVILLLPQPFPSPPLHHLSHYTHNIIRKHLHIVLSFINPHQVLIKRTNRQLVILG